MAKWANPEHLGIIVMRDGIPLYLDRGPDFDAAVALGPAPYGGPLDVVAPGHDPAATLQAERAAMVCSRFQIKAALLQAGLLGAIEAEIDASSALAKLAWAEAMEFRRDSPLINALAAAIGLIDDQIDDLFRAAMGISA